MGLMENGDRPTQQDYSFLAALLRAAQEHLKVGLQGTALGKRLAGLSTSKKFMAMRPAYEGVQLNEDNYGGTGVAYPVLASYLQVGILALSSPIMREDAHVRQGSKGRTATADTRLGHFIYFEPDAEFEQNLSLSGVKQLLEESDKNLAIVVHNGLDGVCY